MVMQINTSITTFVNIKRMSSGIPKDMKTKYFIIDVGILAIYCTLKEDI